MSSPKDNDPTTNAAAADRRRRILEAFDKALDVQDTARDAWLTAFFGDDAKAIESVKALIDADSMAPSIMPTEVPGGDGNTLLVAPQRIGSYRLETMIGSGGMGEVWLGVRDDGLFDQEVAIKLMRPSRYAAQSLAFFDTERRALARLNHRHIARLFDGGVTETGLPWFIMELIDGQPMHIYASGRRLSRSDCLHLMESVAIAVQYAHQQLVVHADLKPSNILITALGVPCLVDFGIASLAASAAEQDDKIAFPSTPAYASPQRLEGAQPTPSDDIFSLGLLLHGLLTMQWPEKPVTSPLTPSGDPACDAIIAKACAATPDGRYATAQALADDLRAVLEHRPTSLQQGDWRVAARLMIRRHPRAVAGGLTGAVGTVAALALITGLYFQAAHERNLAEKRFDDVRSLAGHMLGDFHEELVKLPGSTALRERNAAVGWQYLSRLSQDGDVPIDVQGEIAVGYGRLGNAQATTSSNGTGGVKAGDWALSQSESRLRDLVKRYPQRDDFKRELARTLTWRSGVIFGAHNDPKGARAAIDESLAIDDGVLARNPNDMEAAYDRWDTTIGLSDLYFAQNDMPALKVLMEQTEARFKTLPTPAKYRSLRALLEAATENTLGDATYYAVSPQAGIIHYQNAEGIMAKAIAGDVRDMRLFQRQAYYDYQLASSYVEVQRPQPALVWADKGEAIITDLARYDDSAVTLHTSDILSQQRALALAGLGRMPEAVKEAELAVARRQAVLAHHPEDHENRVSLGTELHRLSTFYATAKEQGKACQTAREAMATFDYAGRHGSIAEHYKSLDMVPLTAFLATCPKS